MPARFRSLFFALCASALLLSQPGRAQQLATPKAPSSAPPATNAPATTLTTPKDASDKMIAGAFQKMNANDVDGALNDLSLALKRNPSSTGAYVLRASIYCQKK